MSAPVLTLVDAGPEPDPADGAGRNPARRRRFEMAAFGVVLLALAAALFVSHRGHAVPSGTPPAPAGPAYSTDPEAGKPAASFADGVWTVDLDIEPGTYRTTVPELTVDCTWDAYRHTSQGNRAVRTGRAHPDQTATITIAPQDFVIVSNHCGNWQRQPEQKEDAR